MNPILSLFILAIIFACNNNKPREVNQNIIQQKDSIFETEILKNSIVDHNEDAIIELNSDKCNCIWDTVESKADWFKKENTLLTDTSEISKEFLDFYSLFNEDSVFQINHIDFANLVGVVGECEETIRLNEINWKYGHWDYSSELNDDNWEVLIYHSSNGFYYEGNLIEVGVIYKIGFERKENEWEMTLVYINNC